MEVRLCYFVDSCYQGSHTHGGAFGRRELQRALKRRSHKVLKAVLNVRGIPKKTLNILNPLKIGDNHPA